MFFCFFWFTKRSLMLSFCSLASFGSILICHGTFVLGQVHQAMVLPCGVRGERLFAVYCPALPFDLRHQGIGPVVQLPPGGVDILLERAGAFRIIGHAAGRVQVDCLKRAHEAPTQAKPIKPVPMMPIFMMAISLSA
jgi:hypothetical protein